MTLETKFLACPLQIIVIDLASMEIEITSQDSKKNPFDLADSPIATGMNVVFGDLSSALNSGPLTINDKSIARFFWLTDTATYSETADKPPATQKFTLQT